MGQVCRAMVMSESCQTRLFCWLLLVIIMSASLANISGQTIGELFLHVVGYHKLGNQPLICEIRLL